MNLLSSVAVCWQQAKRCGTKKYIQMLEVRQNQISDNLKYLCANLSCTGKGNRLVNNKGVDRCSFRAKLIWFIEFVNSLKSNDFSLFLDFLGVMW